MEGVTLENLIKILNDFLPSEKVDDIILNYEDYKQKSLTYLGIDSLSIMGLILNIQKISGKEIDFETFNIEDIESLEKLNYFINN